MEREEIINARYGIPPQNLADFIRRGMITRDDIGDLPKNKLDAIDRFLAEFEEATAEADEEEWIVAKKKNTVLGYKEYLKSFPSGRHVEDARKQLALLEEDFWGTVLGDLTKENLEAYANDFPDGKHIEDCKTYLNDLPFLEVRKRNTIDAYREYMKEFPGKHDEECLQHIEEIEDEKDWERACSINRREAYIDYLEMHLGENAGKRPDSFQKKDDAYVDYLEKYSKGKHAEEAISRIKNRSNKEKFIAELLEDPNCYPPNSEKPKESIKTKIEDGHATWEDLREVFEKRQIDAIQKWNGANELPPIQNCKTLPKGFTEVYFWGTKGTGKTCVIGSLLGSLNNNSLKNESLKNKNRFVIVNSPADPHRQRLTNLFSGKDNIITLPDSTKTTNLPAMPCLIRDEEGKLHPLMLIDMAGEAFTGIYKKKNNIRMTADEETAVKKIEDYLKGKQRNDKIHFFVVEYDAADKEVDPLLPGITQLNILQTVAAYFQAEQIFQKSSVGVYIVITKCDRIRCDKKDCDKAKCEIDCLRKIRAKKANDYVTTGRLGKFTNDLKEDYARNARITNFQKISFSIGNVFAQNLCIFDDTDTEKIIEELLAKSPWITGEKWYERLYGWLKYDYPSKYRGIEY